MWTMAVGLPDDPNLDVSLSFQSPDHTDDFQHDPIFTQPALLDSWNWKPPDDRRRNTPGEIARPAVHDRRRPWAADLRVLA
jgi:hypothetical protein